VPDALLLQRDRVVVNLLFLHSLRCFVSELSRSATLIRAV
jgi:hypothetical protein